MEKIEKIIKLLFRGYFLLIAVVFLFVFVMCVLIPLLVYLINFV